jgi:hypothetical protein
LALLLAGLLAHHGVYFASAAGLLVTTYSGKILIGIVDAFMQCVIIGAILHRRTFLRLLLVFKFGTVIGEVGLSSFRH